MTSIAPTTIHIATVSEQNEITLTPLSLQNTDRFDAVISLQRESAVAASLGSLILKPESTEYVCTRKKADIML